MPPGGGSSPRRENGYVWQVRRASTRWYVARAVLARAPGRAVSKLVKARRPVRAQRTHPGESPPNRKLARATRRTSGGGGREDGE
eukprot:10203846-Alexandrium_andersonii.AAC.1